ncbi:MAG: hypothetical protein QNK19_04390 [Xanthomonadales bacterium]|nr:hypothetical protein [Xanthomonadales bacterium]
MRYADDVGWKQFLPSRFPVVGDDSLSARHPLVSVIARWSAYVLTIGVMLVWTTGLFWWCLATPGHMSRPFDSVEITAFLQFWLIPLLLLYGFSALLAQKRGLSRWLWAIAGIVIVFRLQAGALFLFSASDPEANPTNLSALVIMVIVCLALFSRVALASAQMSRLSLNSVNSVILSCLILFPSIFTISGWVTAGAIQALTPKGVDQWLPVVDSGSSKATHSNYSVTGNFDVIQRLMNRRQVVVEVGIEENRKAFSGWAVDDATGSRRWAVDDATGSRIITFSPVPRLVSGDEIQEKPTVVLREGARLQLSEEETSGLTETLREGQMLVDIHQGYLVRKDPDATQELEWAQQKSDLGSDRIFWNRQQRRFELYSQHARELLSYVSADKSGKFLGYESITSPKRRMIVSFENGVWSLKRSGRQLSLTQLYSTPPSQHLLNVVKSNNQRGLKDRIWPVLTNQSFSVYQSEIPENDRVVYLTELPGLKTAKHVRAYTSPWHGGVVVIMQQQNAGLMHYEILRYDAAGALISRSPQASVPLGVGFGGVTAFGALLSPVVYSSLPYGAFGIFSLANVHRPQLKMSAWQLGIALNIVTILLMFGLIHRIKPGKRVGMAWIACAVVFSLPTLLMFLIWMPWRERKERQRIRREQNRDEQLESLEV